MHVGAWSYHRRCANVCQTQTLRKTISKPQTPSIQLQRQMARNGAGSTSEDCGLAPGQTVAPVHGAIIIIIIIIIIFFFFFFFLWQNTFYYFSVHTLVMPVHLALPKHILFRHLVYSSNSFIFRWMKYMNCCQVSQP